MIEVKVQNPHNFPIIMGLLVRQEARVGLPNAAARRLEAPETIRVFLREEYPQFLRQFDPRAHESKRESERLAMSDMNSVLFALDQAAPSLDTSAWKKLIRETKFSDEP